MCWSSHEEREWLEAKRRDAEKKDDEPTWVSEEKKETDAVEEPDRERELVHT